jgi:hypothetical protein
MRAAEAQVYLTPDTQPSVCNPWLGKPVFIVINFIIYLFIIYLTEFII